MEDEKIVQIGKINLDLTHYPGEDLYCDGEIENTLLDIAKNYSEVEFPRIIEEQKSWEILYHLSPLRENIVEWLPLQKNMKVLEVGAGCGAITGALAEKAGKVTCIDLSKKRSMINAYRHMNRDNIEIQVGNFLDVEPDLANDYDYICLIGVFEYAQAYISTETPYESFLEILQKHLKKDGRIVIAIENRFGLKYWAGCREDHLGTYFSGIENYPDGGVVRTFTRNSLEKIFARCNVNEYSFYYPYPDYKFMTSIYSDSYLPKQGELSNNMRNFDRDRMVLFDEKKAFDSIIKEGKFPDYSNSYLIVIGKDLQTKYVKYSNDRQPEYQIRTEICSENYMGLQKGDAQDNPELFHFVVRKHPLNQLAVEHIVSIDTAYEKLRERYKGSELKINRCKLVEAQDQIHEAMTEEKLLEKSETEEAVRPYVELEYLQGITLAELMDQCLEKEDMNGFLELFRCYEEAIDYNSDMPVADFDLVFSNIILCRKDPRKPFDAFENATWNLIDYEWTFGKQVSTQELAFRAIYCYLLEDPKRNKCNLDLIMNELGVNDEEAADYREQELSFQHYVTGNRRSMTEIRDLIGFNCIDTESCIQKVFDWRAKGRVQIYEDHGDGYHEETAYFSTDVQENDTARSLSMKLDPEIRQLRLDPAMTYCIVTIRSIKWNDTELVLDGKTSPVSTNGIRIGESNSFVFPSQDPNINLSFETLRAPDRKEENELEADWEITFLTETMAKEFAKANQPKRRFHL
jgi:SAM-dependent methyltransferase